MPLLSPILAGTVHYNRFHLLFKGLYNPSRDKVCSQKWKWQLYLCRMIRTLISVALASLTLASQRPKKQQTEPAAAAPDSAVLAAPSAAAQPVGTRHCYELREGRKMAEAELLFKGDSVTGRLDYLLSDRDQSQG